MLFFQCNTEPERSTVRGTCRSSLQPVYRDCQAELSVPYGTQRFHHRICS